MTEELVTLKTYHMLKEKGFNAPWIPNLSFVQKWMREIKGVYIWPEPVIGRRWKIAFCDFNVPIEESDWIDDKVNKEHGYSVYGTYEEALEAGIQEALKFI